MCVATRGSLCICLFANLTLTSGLVTRATAVEPLEQLTWLLLPAAQPLRCKSTTAATVCIQAAVPWHYCCEFALSDHFINQACVEFEGGAKHSSDNAPLPTSWHNPTRWSAGLQHAEQALNAIYAAAQCWAGIPDNNLGTTSRTIKRSMSWVLGTLAWLQCVVGNVVREAFVHMLADTASCG